MSVSLTISETLNGSAVADALAGGGTGVDFGSVVNGQYAPIINQTNNEGAQTLYIRHDAVIDPITDVKTFIQQYGTGTGFTYGGANSAASDIATLISEGNLSGSSKNNADGQSSGIWVDMDADASTVNQFNQASFPAVVKVYGDNNTDGISLSSAFQVSSASMVVNSGGETLATSPVSGQIGKSGDLVLGDNAKLKFRAYLRSAFPSGGIVQFELVVSYSFTA